MGYVTYESMNSATARNQESGQVGFFSLKNDGDEAIVRIMHDSTRDFEIIATHSIQVNGKFRRVNCVRNPKDPLDTCPLCASGVKTEYRFYIHLIQYTKAEDGSIVAEPKVWERSSSYADKISGYINNYGPMSDVICKIIRRGKAGDMKTEYEIVPNLSKQIYRDDLFVKIPNAFDGFKSLGRVVLDRSAEDIEEFIRTGNFPMKQKDQTEEKPTEKVEVAQAPTQTFNQTQPDWSAPEQTQTTARPQFGGWSNNQSTIQRPTRF